MSATRRAGIHLIEQAIGLEAAHQAVQNPSRLLENGLLGIGVANGQ